MNKLKEFIAEHIGAALGSLALLVLAWLATVGYSFCHLLGVNAIYCDPLVVRIPFFLIVGALIGVAWGRVSRRVLGVALIGVIILEIISHFASLPRTPQEIIEFVLVVPFQVAIGVIVGQILIWIWAHFGSFFKAWLRRVMGLTKGNGQGDAKTPH